jgi:hypothetical protein
MSLTSNGFTKRYLRRARADAFGRDGDTASAEADPEFQLKGLQTLRPAREMGLDVPGGVSDLHLAEVTLLCPGQAFTALTDDWNSASALVTIASSA